VVYHIRPGSKFLPHFQALDPRGVIYTSSLNVPPRSFKEGFPGVTNRFEWFAIDYKGRFWIEKPGTYQFALTSDDGAKLYIDDELVVDNDGLHPPEVKTARFGLSGGIHRIRVSYFQGPREEVALILRWLGRERSGEFSARTNLNLPQIQRPGLTQMPTTAPYRRRLGWNYESPHLRRRQETQLGRRSCSSRGPEESWSR
jgi:PA14 domain